MTEQKKDYMIDALGELEDRYIEEAVNYVKGRITWRYGKELGALAACVAVVFLSVSAYHILPFKGATDNATGAPKNMEMVKQEQVIEGVTAEGIAPETAPENSASKETIKEYASKGIQWDVVESAEQGGINDTSKESDRVNQSVGNGKLEGQVIQELQSTSLEEWLSAEELFAMDTAIFKGTVVEMQAYHVTGGMDKYCTIVMVEVEDNIRGDLEVGDTCRIYLPFARIDGDITFTNSINGDLDKLEVGSRAIFMPRKATKETGIGTNDVWLSYADFAEYYFSEGMRFLFLETEDGVSYAKDVYEIESEGKLTLEDVAEYIREMIG